MEIEAVAASYRRWAPVYDSTFGAFTRRGRRRAVEHVNRRGGCVLEVGVGTGLSLALLRPQLEVTGIDFSAEMLAKAEAKVEAARARARSSRSGAWTRAASRSPTTASTPSSRCT